MYCTVKIDPTLPLVASILPAVEALLELEGPDFYLDEDRSTTIRGEDGLLFVETVEK